MGPSATTLFKLLSARLSVRHSKCYSQVFNWIRCRNSFSLLRSSITCLRGARSSIHHPCTPSTHMSGLSLMGEFFKPLYSVLYSYLHPMDIGMHTSYVYFFLGIIIIFNMNQYMYCTCRNLNRNMYSMIAIFSSCIYSCIMITMYMFILLYLRQSLSLRYSVFPPTPPRHLFIPFSFSCKIFRYNKYIYTYYHMLVTCLSHVKHMQTSCTCSQIWM